MTTVLHHDTPEVPADPAPTRGPRFDADRVDALDCRAPAAHRVGSRLVCDYHRLEVLHAYWECDSSIPLFEVEVTVGYRCGDVWPEVWS